MIYIYIYIRVYNKTSAGDANSTGLVTFSNLRPPAQRISKKIGWAKVFVYYFYFFVVGQRKRKKREDIDRHKNID